MLDVLVNLAMELRPLGDGDTTVLLGVLVDVATELGRLRVGDTTVLLDVLVDVATDLGLLGGSEATFVFDILVELCRLRGGVTTFVLDTLDARTSEVCRLSEEPPVGPTCTFESKLVLDLLEELKREPDTFGDLLAFVSGILCLI